MPARISRVNVDLRSLRQNHAPNCRGRQAVGVIWQTDVPCNWLRQCASLCALLHCSPPRTWHTSNVQFRPSRTFLLRAAMLQHRDSSREPAVPKASDQYPCCTRHTQRPAPARPENMWQEKVLCTLHSSSTLAAGSGKLQARGWPRDPLTRWLRGTAQLRSCGMPCNDARAAGCCCSSVGRRGTSQTVPHARRYASWM